MRPKIFTRAMMAVWLIYIPVAELGATGSFGRMLDAFVVLSAMAFFGWLERDNTKVGAGETAAGADEYEEGYQHGLNDGRAERPNDNVTGLAPAQETTK